MTMKKCSIFMCLNIYMDGWMDALFALLFQAANSSMSDEELYQGARKIVGAYIQTITYNEWLPALMGEGALSPYTG